MKNDHGQELLQSHGIRQLLKEMILEKYEHHQKVLSQVLKEEESNELISSEITDQKIYQLFFSYLAKAELPVIERDLSSMCFQLNKSLNKLPTQTNWDRAYENATQLVRIEDVISHFTGITKLKCNIPCPFHKDKTPSLKVYPESNRFVCFGCQVRGSPIDFVMKHKDCSFQEAVLYLSNF